MNTPRPQHEHEFEPQHGLPERLPAGERILWQGGPETAAIARRVFHLDKVIVYFALLLAWAGYSTWRDGGDLGAMLLALRWPLAAALGGAGLLLLLARWTAATTVYTLTDKRIVMRIGIVLTVTYNLPLVRIESADHRDAGGGCGDIALTLERGTRIAWLHLWPHVRPWHLSRPRPMLRGLQDARRVETLLAQAWSKATGEAASPRRESPVGESSHRPAAVGAD